MIFFVEIQILLYLGKKAYNRESLSNKFTTVLAPRTEASIVEAEDSISINIVNIITRLKYQL